MLNTLILGKVKSRPFKMMADLLQFMGLGHLAAENFLNYRVYL